MIHASFFTGIGGFDLAAEWMGWENAFHCEWNPFGQQVLKYYWPNSISYANIKDTDFNIWNGRIDVVTGGFPCQPYSTAGKRLGKDDDRHLWPEMLRGIREIKPRWVVGENVRGLVSWNGGLVFDEVQADLEAEGYEVIPFLLPACAVNAPHRRDRIWFVAYAGNNGSHGTKDRQSLEKGNDCNEAREIKAEQLTRRSFQEQFTSNAKGNGNSRGLSEMEKENGGFWKPEKHRENDTRFGNISGKWIDTNLNGIGLRGKSDWLRNSKFIGEDSPGNYWRNFPTQPPVCRRNDGLPTGLAGITVSKHRKESIRAYGNAVVPQVVYQIFKAIQQHETLHQATPEIPE